MSTALYRRYRPDNFAEMIGQDQVTAPLMQALRSNRVNHAYLFSGPRGCGKTTSARILARILNCHENTEANPTDTPCEVCPSCVELARGGSGSLDVVEIDAASHGGVEDARDLRERATFSPSRDRFKIFILDEAHMVTAQGFNALLKIVEEPPSYLKFIFATTEPDKVIGTIRSRTHHYPFKLVGPATMQGYLEQLCAAENIAVGAGVLPLVVRAGGGSVRDTLSVLDQLMAGSGPEGLEYDRAVGLLGFTPTTLLDDVVESLAARDGASMFRVVEQVVSTGHEPRRFVEDLLERLRDLIVISLASDNAQAVLGSVPQDQFDRMATQAQNLGAAELSRSADVVNDALSSMTGATSPRLHLELLCARLLLPAADSSAGGLGARIDGIERALSTGASLPAGGTATAGTSAAIAPDQPRASLRPESTRTPAKRPDSTRTQPVAPVVRETVSPVAAAGPVVAPAPVVVEPAPTPVVAAPIAPAPVVTEPAVVTPRVATPGAQALEPAAVVPSAPIVEPVVEAVEAPVQPEAAQPEPVQAAPAPVAAEPAPVAPAAASATSGGADQHTEALRRRWPEVLETLKSVRRATWTLVDQHAQIARLSADTLFLSFSSPGLLNAFNGRGGADQVQIAIKQTLDFDVRVEGQIGSAEAAPVAPAPAQVAPVAEAPAPPVPAAAAVVPPASAPVVPAETTPVAAPTPELAPEPAVAPVASSGEAPSANPGDDDPWGAAIAQASAPEEDPWATPAPAPSKPAQESDSMAEFAAPVAPAAPETQAMPVNIFGAAVAAFAQSHQPEVPVATSVAAAAADVVEELQRGAQATAPISEPQDADPYDPGPEPQDDGYDAYAQPRAVAPAMPAPAGDSAVEAGLNTVAPWDESPRQLAERRAQEKAREDALRVSVVDDPQPDDEDLESSNLVGVPLVIKKLGGVIIEEVTEDPYQ